MAAELAVPRALEVMKDQPVAQRLLAAGLAEGRLSHAYLFLGPPGAGKLDAAYALAQCVLCPNGGDASCDECIRVAHHAHPDVHLLKPESATGYLVAQVRGLVGDTALAPIRGAHKVYILQEVGLLRGAAANALLKTLEEPPANVIFILIARSEAQVMPTIASRCLLLPFQVISPDRALRAVELASGADGVQARVALAVAHTPARAAGFLASPERRAARKAMIRALAGLPHDDSWDVLLAARSVVEAARAPLETLKDEQSEALKENEDFLSATSRKRVQDANKRELTWRERSAMMETLAAAESVLRDVLLRCGGISDDIVNEDVADVVDALARTTTEEGALRALTAVQQAADNINHNVGPQLATEVMLLAVKEAL